MRNGKDTNKCDSTLVMDVSSAPEFTQGADEKLGIGQSPVLDVQRADEPQLAPHPRL